MEHEKSHKEYIAVTFVGVGLGLACIVAAKLLLPENCLFYEYRQVGLLCDAFIVGQPGPPCPVCSNESLATVARIGAVLSVALLLLPLIVFGIRKWRQRG